MPLSELKLISWTAVIVVILGVASVFSLMQPPRGFETVASHGLSGRSIASISPAKIDGLQPAFAKIATELQTMDIKATCKTDEPISVAASIREVRLTGPYCSPSAKVVTTTIKNVTNGFVATVFHPSAKSFTTDYVTLSKGENRILVREELASGKFKEREYQFVRN